MLQLSGDQNTDQGKMPNIQLLLDMQASELDSHLYGRVNLPIPLQTVPATGLCSLLSVPADNSTVTLSDGLLSATFTFLSGGIGTNQVNTVTGNTADIAAIWASAINAAGLQLVAQSRLYMVAIVNKTVVGIQPPSGYAGNVPIISTAGAAIQISGMAGGSTLAPLILTKIVAATTARRLFARRNAIPEEVKADCQECDEWLAKLDGGIVIIANVPPANVPTLQDSNFAQGSSQFDYVFGTIPSPSGPVGPGNVN